MRRVIIVQARMTSTRLPGKVLLDLAGADCPLIDPQETDRVVEALVSNAQACDYASNVVERTLPRGLDAEAMFADTLERLDRLATSASAREHVTSFMHAAGASGAVPDPRGHGHRQQRGSALDR